MRYGVSGKVRVARVLNVLCFCFRSHSFKSSRGSNQDSFRSILRRDGGQDQVHANATASDSPAPVSIGAVICAGNCDSSPLPVAWHGTTAYF